MADHSKSCIQHNIVVLTVVFSLILGQIGEEVGNVCFYEVVKNICFCSRFYVGTAETSESNFYMLSLLDK